MTSEEKLDECEICYEGLEAIWKCLAIQLETVEDCTHAALISNLLYLSRMVLRKNDKQPI